MIKKKKHKIVRSIKHRAQKGKLLFYKKSSNLFRKGATFALIFKKS